jgi:hypothetical protein
MAGGGSWPTTKNELVTTHIGAFARFVTSIEFNKIKLTLQLQTLIEF